MATNQQQITRFETSSVKQMCEQPLTCVPAAISASLSVQMPATNRQKTMLNGQRVALFPGVGSNDKNSFYSGDVTSSFSKCNMILRGAGVRLSVNPRLGSIQGVAVNVPAGATAPVPVVDGPPGTGDSFINATLSYNMDATEAVYHFGQAFRLIFEVGCNYSVFDQRVADIGTMGSQDSYCGFGDALSPTQNMIAEVNNYYANASAADGIGQVQFIPPNSSTGVTSPTTITPISPPMMNTQWGGRCQEGLYGGIFPFPFPLFLSSRTAFQAYFYVDGEDSVAQYHLQKFQSLISDNGPETLGEKWTAAYDALTGSTPNGAAVYGFKGGEFDIAFELLGCNVKGGEIAEYFTLYARSMSDQLKDFYLGMDSAQIWGSLSGSGRTGVAGAPITDEQGNRYSGPEALAALISGKASVPVTLPERSFLARLFARFGPWRGESSLVSLRSSTHVCCPHT